MKSKFKYLCSVIGKCLRPMLALLVCLWLNLVFWLLCAPSIALLGMAALENPLDRVLQAYDEFGIGDGLKDIWEDITRG